MNLFTEQNGKNITDRFQRERKYLFLIDNEENLEMNRSKLRFENPNLTETGLQIAKLAIAVRQRKKQR